jgi:mRNA interferase RelE/StbE
VAYTVLVTPAFKRDLKKLDRRSQKRIFGTLDSLADEPRPRGVEKLKENAKFYRIRSGDYRIVYSIDDEKSIAIVCLVRHRKDAYRDIASLNISEILDTLKPLLVGKTAAAQ